MIINNSSVAGLRGMARLSHYAASKWGLVGLTKSWAIELAPYNIRVVALCPTGVNTPMNDGLAMLEGKTPQEIAERSAGNLLPDALDRAGGRRRRGRVPGVSPCRGRSPARNSCSTRDCSAGETSFSDPSHSNMGMSDRAPSTNGMPGRISSR